MEEMEMNEWTDAFKMALLKQQVLTVINTSLKKK